MEVALIEDKTGPLEASARHLVAGFRLGPEYAGKGSNTAPARRIEILQQDSHFRPYRGPTAVEWVYDDDKLDLAIGGSGMTLAMLPVAQNNEKLPTVESPLAGRSTRTK